MVADQKQRRIAAREKRIIYELGKLAASDLDIYEVGNPDGVFPYKSYQSKYSTS